MNDPRNEIQKRFETTCRYENFGEILTRMRIQGVRCHQDTIIEFQNPISAICGLNGVGKSTILQLAAAAYKETGESYHIRDFLVIGTLDPSPFKPNASIEFKFWQRDRSNLTRTLSRNRLDSRWNGYSRRPVRRVFFTGIGQYLPKIEQRDFIVSKADKLVISNSQAVLDIAKKWICNILACSYENVTTNIVTYTEHGTHQIGEVVSVRRLGKDYSEAHMGFGEGRTQYLISAIENLPNQSLVLIEEPETSLHPSAQYQLGLYLMDVVIRKRHQIIVTTHSPFILKSLPSQSRIYLKRVDEEINIIPGLSASQIRSLLADGKEKALDILVEDNCGASILRELVRKVDPTFLQSIDIYPAGSAQNIMIMVKALKEKLPIAAVLDGDQSPEPQNNIFSLPGSRLAPEKLLFADNAIKNYVLSVYGINLDDFTASLTHLDHHGWLARLGERLNQSQESLLAEFARVFALSHEMDAYVLTQQIKDALK